MYVVLLDVVYFTLSLSFRASAQANSDLGCLLSANHSPPVLIRTRGMKRFARLYDIKYIMSSRPLPLSLLPQLSSLPD